MLIAGRFTRRVLGVLLAVGLALPATASAAPDEDVVVLVRRAQREIEAARKPGATDAASRYSTAGELYGRAAARMPEYEENRVARDDLLAQAVSAYIEASTLAGDDLGPLRAAFALVQEHLDALDRVYGRSAAKLPEHAHAREFRDDLAKRPGVVVEAPTPTEEPAKVEPDAPVEPQVKSEPEPKTELSPEPKRSDWRKIGLGVSLGLTVVSLGAAIGTASAVAVEPFEGPLYRDIYAAALRDGVPVMPGVNMCDQGKGLSAPHLIDACAARDRAARAAVAMTVLTGVFAVSSVVFGVLLAKSKRREVATLRRHRPGFGVGPAPGGGFVVVGGAF